MRISGAMGVWVYNAAGEWGGTSSAQLGVSTGGVHILKTDLKGEPIPGVSYRLFREATLDEHADPLVQKEWLEIAGEQKEVVCVAFYPEPDFSETPVLRTSTGEEGTASFFGVPYGTYYIQEEAPPQGYNPQPQPVEARINSLTSDATILIETTAASSREPPVATLITAALVAVTSSAALLILMNSKSKWP